MIKNVALPKNCSFLKNKDFLKDFFSQFYSKPTILGFKISSIKMAGELKIFGEYKIREKNKVRKVLAIYRFSGTKKEEFEILKHLFYFKFTDPKFLIPKPIFYFEKEKLIFYEALKGVPFSEIKPEILLKILKEKSKDIALSLIKIQKTKPPAKVYNLEDDLKKFEIFEKVFNKHFRKKSERELIKALFSILRKERIYYFKNLKNFSFCHNDFTFGNLIYQRGKIGLIDFSSSCFSDPIFDLGKFLGQLDYLLYLDQKKEKEILEIERLFLGSYFGGEKFSKEFQEKIFLYRAWTNIENSIFVLGAEEKKQNKEGSFWFLQQAKEYLEAKIFE